MPDILIIRRRNRAYIFIESEVGKKWITDNCTFDTETPISMDYDLVEDLIKIMEKDDIEVEVK